ncbi:MAG: hypothetical protein OEZ36_07785 [Spirochaetota bacterium]|nr:hypothetical protein [Spirochaetota bacterium]
MNKIISTLSLIFISFSFFGREHHFFPGKFLKEVEVNGQIYRVVPFDYIHNNHKIKLKTPLKPPNLKGHKVKPLLVLNRKGKLIRDIPTLTKVLFTATYSQLSYPEITELTNPLIMTQEKLGTVLKQKALQGKTYLKNFKLLEYLIHKDVPFDEELLSTIHKGKLIDFIDNLLRDPDSGFLLIIREILSQSKDLCQKGIKQFLGLEGVILSYEEALELEGFRHALAYGAASYDFLKSETNISHMKLSQAKTKTTTIINQFSPYGVRAVLKNKPKRNLIVFAKDIIQIVYGDEVYYKKYLDFIKTGRTNIIRNLDDYLSQARYSASFIPFYQSNYSDYPVAPHIKSKYPHTLFHDNFSGSLNRWLFFGSGKPYTSGRDLKISTNGWYYSGASSRVLFNPRGGDIHMELLARLGQGKGSFGFGQKLVGPGGKKGIIPKLGFLFNQDIDGSGSVDFRINNELVETQFRLMLNLRKDHSFKLIITKDNGVFFFIDDKKVYENSFSALGFASESVVFSSKSNDYLWKELFVQQIPK